MARKTKMYIPLVTNSKNGRTQLVNADKVTSLKSIMPSEMTLREHLLAFTINSKKHGTKYMPFVVKVNEEKWNELTKELNSKVPGHKFFRKGFDIISDSTAKFSLVQVVLFDKEKKNS